MMTVSGGTVKVGRITSDQATKSRQIITKGNVRRSSSSTLPMSSRRCQVDVFDSHHVNRILDAGANMLGVEVRVTIPNDLRKGKAVTDEFQHVPNGDACTGDAGFPEMDVRVDADSLSHVSS